MLFVAVTLTCVPLTVAVITGATVEEEPLEETVADWEGLTLDGRVTNEVVLAEVGTRAATDESLEGEECDKLDEDAFDDEEAAEIDCDAEVLGAEVTCLVCTG